MGAAGRELHRGLSRDGPRDTWSQQRGLAPEQLALPPWLPDLTGSWAEYRALLDAHGTTSDTR